MLTLNTIKAQPGSNHYSKRLGRGSGSGHGPTAGKGDKGQLARSGGVSRAGFEGGQMPLYRRLPKRGFTNFTRVDRAIINVGDLNRLELGGTDISLETLRKSGVVKGRHEQLVVLGTGELKKALKIKAHKVSPSALEKIQAAGGTVEILVMPSLRAERLEEYKKEKAQKPKGKKK